MLRTVTRVVLRTIAAEQTKQKIKNKDGLLNLLINVGIDVFTNQLEMADLRSGLYLPASIQIIRIPYTGANSLKIKALSASGMILKSEEQQLNDGFGQNKQFVIFSSVE
jgi:hypothetical protein